jgi:predicted Zn finger-like uncharacterized protein
MKIACQSCQAKYTIADEKVLGRVVKIRCKKCGATIVINGNEAAADGGPVGAEEPTQAAPTSKAFDYAAQHGEEPWTVNVADGDQRTMTTADVVAQYKAGVINDETYCWKDGMGDWLPLREVDSLIAACGLGGPPPQPAYEPPQPVAPARSLQPVQQAARAVPAAPSSGAGLGALFGGMEPVAAAPPPDANGYGALRGGGAAAPAAARRAGGRAGAADLFGAAAEAGGENDVMTSAPQSTPAMHGDEKLTGQRNENSVLFSLNALTQSAPKESTPGPIGDGSGLIDIRALSANMAPKDKKTNHVDDIMNLGGGGAFTAALAAPVLAPPSAADAYGGTTPPGEKNRKLMLVIIARGVVVAGLLVAVILSLRKPPEAAGASTTPAGSVASPGETAAATASAVPVASAAPTASETSTAAAPGAAATPGDTSKSTSGASHKSAGGGGGGGGGAAVAATTAPAAVPPAGGGGGSLEEEMRRAGGGGAAPAPAPAPASTAAFDRGAAAAALGAVNVASCKKADGPTGGGHVAVTFAANGSVSSAIADAPPFAGSAVGGCIAGKFRGARVPAFGGAPVKVGKSFVLN